MTEFNEAQLAQASLAFIRVGFRVLAQRAMEFVALVAAIGLFGVALAEQTMPALAVAAVYSVLVFLPVLMRGRREKTE